MEVLLVILTHLWPIIAGVLTILIAAGSKKLLDKWGLERSAQIDGMIDNYAQKAVDYAEVLGRNYLTLNSTKLSGASKKANAVSMVLKELEKSGITNVAEQVISARIEHWLEVKGLNPGIPSDPESPGESA